MMMKLYKYLAVVLLLVSTINGRTIENIDRDIDNNIIPANNENNEKLSFWTTLKLLTPPKIIQQPGETVELQCQLAGSVRSEPHPTIYWTSGNDSHDIDILESNVMSEINEGTWIQIISRLIVENSSALERTFTCYASANGETGFQSTTIFSAPQNVNELLSTNSGAKRARITLYYGSLFDKVGKDVVLPCEVADRPNTEIYWTDTEDNVISGQNHRFRVDSSGSLYISPLAYEDKGEFMCVAKNGPDEDSILTFVYPFANEELD